MGRSQLFDKWKLVNVRSVPFLPALASKPNRRSLDFLLPPGVFLHSLENVRQSDWNPPNEGSACRLGHYQGYVGWSISGTAVSEMVVVKLSTGTTIEMLPEQLGTGSKIRQPDIVMKIHSPRSQHGHIETF
jgi:hypothetical protein